jgi:epsin
LDSDVFGNSPFKVQTSSAANVNSISTDQTPSFTEFPSNNGAFSVSGDNFEAFPPIIPPPQPPVQASNITNFTTLPHTNGGGLQGGNNFNLFPAPPAVASNQSSGIHSVGEDIFGLSFNANNGAANGVAPSAVPPQQDTFSSIFEPSYAPPAQISTSQPVFSQNTDIHAGARFQQEKKFETKSTVWSESISKGLIDLNISGRKYNSFS